MRLHGLKWGPWAPCSFPDLSPGDHAEHFSCGGTPARVREALRTRWAPQPLVTLQPRWPRDCPPVFFQLRAQTRREEKTQVARG